jgi:type I restriction enzyme M protein
VTVRWAGRPATLRFVAVREPVIRNHSAFIWAVADLLRGDYKQSEYGRVILPLTVLRRLDCVLEPTKGAVLNGYERWRDRVKDPEPILREAAGGLSFYNTSPLTFRKLLDDPDRMGDNLIEYVNGFSSLAADVMEKFDFRSQVRRLERADLLYQVVGRFCEIDLHPEKVSNLEMGYLYEELIRRFSELSNETAGEHFTPREVIQLMVNLLFSHDEDLLTRPHIVKTICDPACGTGGMLSEAENHLRRHNPQANLEVFGQELNAETYAVCRSDMMLKGQDATNIHYGNSFSEDHLRGRRFDYLIANPPFGVEWKKVQDVVKREHEKDGFAGRFGAGLPRINDGSLLFLQHMLSKMKPAEEGGSRVAIVFNGSPLFTGAAGSGESEIRRWIIENDWLEGIVALPDQLFYNTGISTYFWVLTNRKRPERRGKVQLVDARELFVKMGKSLGEKRKRISDEQIEEITRLYGDYVDGERVKILPNHAFGHQRITVERPLRVRWEVSEETLDALDGVKALDGQAGPVREALRPLAGLQETDEQRFKAAVEPVLRRLPLKKWGVVTDALVVRDPEAPVVRDRRGNPEPDSELRDSENVPLPAVPVAFEAEPTARLASMEHRSVVEDHMEREVLPYVPDAWVEHAKTKVGYEIPVTRHFYKYVPPRPLAEIDAEIKALEAEIQLLLAEVTQ